MATPGEWMVSELRSEGRPASEVAVGEPQMSAAQGAANGDLSIGPAATEPSSPDVASARSNRVTWVACTLFGSMVAMAVAFGVSLEPMARAGVSACAFLSGLGCAVSVVALVRRQRNPGGLTDVCFGTLCAALGAAVAPGLGVIMRWQAFSAAKVLDPALGAYLMSEAALSARSMIWLSALALPGFSLGALGILLAYGERKKLRRASQPTAAPALALLGFVGSLLVFFGALAANVWTLWLPAPVVEHPALPQLRVVRTQLASGDLERGCAGLDSLLAPGAVPGKVLNLELAQYQEYSHRCVTHRIDSLPKGLPCATAAGALLASEVVRVAKARERVMRACDQAFAP